MEVPLPKAQIARIHAEIIELKKRLNVVIAAHFYQRDEVIEVADIIGDSLDLARKVVDFPCEAVLFCGVRFMGESVKILAPNKRVIMPKIACCSMARMIDSQYFDQSIALLESYGIAREGVFPLSYINSSAEIKAKVGAMGGLICTSANAGKIMAKAQESGKKIFFLPDRCLGQNLAHKNAQKSAVLGSSTKEQVLEADVVCYDGFCSVHQLFTPADVEFFRARFPGILVAVHPECDPSVVQRADFVGSTSQLAKYVQSLSLEQKVVVGTEYNFVHRLRAENTYVLSSTRPECPTMNETTLGDVLAALRAFEHGGGNEILLSDEVANEARIALNGMLELS